MPSINSGNTHVLLYYLPSIKCLIMFSPQRITTKLHVGLHPMPAQIMAGNLYYAWANAAETLKNMRDFILEKNDKRLVLYGIISTQKQR